MNYGIYIYFDGSDLHDIANDFRNEMKAFIEKDKSIKLVDILHPRDEDMEEDDLTDWDMGINFELSKRSEKEIEELLFYFSQLSSKFDRDFAVGYYNQKNGMSEDIGFIEIGKDYSGILDVIRQLKN